MFFRKGKNRGQEQLACGAQLSVKVVRSNQTTGLWGRIIRMLEDYIERKNADG